MSQGSPWRVGPLRAVAPDWLLPGHIPAQDASAAGEGNRAGSAPISARMTCAVRRLAPGTVSISSS
ncbi:hypothetical protein QOZ89_42895 [Pseudofrankia sp. BMG5.37]|nr:MULTISPECIES: hypothetical protein [unclassified Pseudofrankia]MDT3446277.1 hypothetical protein [Pseudofrankia sp. BMG5.37]